MEPSVKRKRKSSMKIWRRWKKTYKERWNVHIMADYCWMLQPEVPEGLHKWKSTTYSFESIRLRFHKKKCLCWVTVQTFHVVCILSSQILFIFFMLFITYTIMYFILLVCIYEYHHTLYFTTLSLCINAVCNTKNLSKFFKQHR